MPQACLGQSRAQLSNPIFAAHQGKHPPVGPHIRDNIVGSAMKAGDIHVLVGGLQSGAQGYQGAYPRNHLCVAVFQQRKQLFRAAEKPGITGHDHGKPPVFPVCQNIVRNGFGIDGAVSGLSGCRRVQHPPRADQAVGSANGRLGICGHGSPASGAQTHNADLGSPYAPKSFT